MNENDSLEEYYNSFLFDSDAFQEIPDPPTYLNLKQTSNLKIMNDRLTVTYTGRGTQGEIASIQAETPLNTNKRIAYFEVKIKDCGLSKGQIAIGLSDKDFQLNKQVGFLDKSYGYKADGKVFHGKNTGENYGSKFSIKSTIGCGIIYTRREIFFTLNGKFEGTAFKNVNLCEYYPTISLFSQKDEAKANFNNSPFKFDIQTMIMEEYLQEIDGIMHQNILSMDIQKIIHNYLHHFGYVETLHSFNEEAGIEKITKQGVKIKSKIVQEDKKKRKPVRSKTKNESTKGSLREEAKQPPKTFPSLLKKHDRQEEDEELKKKNEESLKRKKLHSMDPIAIVEEPDENSPNPKEELNKIQLSNDPTPDKSNQNIENDTKEQEKDGESENIKIQEEEKKDDQIQDSQNNNNEPQRTNSNGSPSNVNNQTEQSQNQLTDRQTNLQLPSMDDAIKRQISLDMTELSELSEEELGPFGTKSRSESLSLTLKKSCSVDSSLLISLLKSSGLENGTRGCRFESLDQIKTNNEHQEENHFEERGILRQLLLNGFLFEAKEFIKQHFKTIWKENEQIRISLMALRFIDLIRDNKIGEAIKYVRNYLADYHDRHIQLRDRSGKQIVVSIQEIVGLIAYENVEESDLAYLLDLSQRDAVADFINLKILRAKNYSREEAVLELLVKQLLLTQNVYLEKNMNLGPKFQLKL